MNKENTEKKARKSKESRGRKPPKNPYKIRIYKIYLLWATLPVAVKRFSSTELEKLGFDTKDELLKKLLSIQTKTEFCKEFGIAPSRISAWEKKEDFQEKVNKLVDKSILEYKKDVDFQFTRRVITEADAARVKLWYQIYMGWSERQILEHEPGDKLSDLLLQIQNEKQPLVKNRSSQREDNGEGTREKDKGQGMETK